MSILNVLVSDLMVVGRGYYFYKGQLVRCDVNRGRGRFCGGATE
jgi:hypothetical protein